MKFDDTYELLADLYADKAFNKKSCDQLKNHLKQLISAIEQGQKDPTKVQKLCGKVTSAAAKLFPGKTDDVRDVLAADLLYILEWFELDLDVEDVMQGL